mgnify:FL=1|tara:strand:- start:131 stop:385 length:255 start_codon:yes stop_codon:yes gene_type:complete
MKILVTLSAVAFLGACTPGHIAANKGTDRWEWVGCHVVKQNPSPTGEYAISPNPFEDLPVGAKIFFKQVGKDGKVGPVTTGDPC